MGAQREREHHWDWLRALLLLLGIPYHVFLSYRGGGDWIVHSGEGAVIYGVMADFIHLFRMPAFFIVAGYFAALMLERKGAGPWLRGRLMRVGVPFLTCLLFITPIMNWACEISNFSPAQAWPSFLHSSATSGGYWVRHLWFIIVLLYFCAVLAGAATLFPVLRHYRLNRLRDTACARHFMIGLMLAALGIGLWEAGAIELFYKAGLATNGPQQIMRLDEALQYAPWFLIGVIVARAPEIRARFYRFSGFAMLLGVAAACLSLVAEDRLGPMQGRFIAAVAALMLSQCLIATVARVASRPHPLVSRLVDASFVIYLVHMPVIIWLVLAGQGHAMPLALKVLAVTVLALAISYGLWLLIDRSPLLRFLLDGRKGEKTGPVIRPNPALYRDRRCDPHPSLP